jgi:hypothetical protein
VVRVAQVDQVVGHALHLRARRLGGPDVHAPVDLHAVDGDDLGAELLRDPQRHLGLAGGRRADDCRYLRHRFCVLATA